MYVGVDVWVRACVRLVLYINVRVSIVVTYERHSALPPCAHEDNIVHCGIRMCMCVCVCDIDIYSALCDRYIDVRVCIVLMCTHRVGDTYVRAFR